MAVELALTSLLFWVSCCRDVNGLPWVQRAGTQLHVNGHPWYFVGVDAYWLVDVSPHPDRQWLVSDFMQRAQSHGFKVVRTWGFNHNSPASAGTGSQRLTYDESEMRGLDFVIQQASAHGMYLILAAGNLWKHYVGPEVFLWAAGDTGGDLANFYMSSAARSLYKQHIGHLLNRVNTLTGQAYKNDPTIMGWDVLNEPRCPGCMDGGQKAAHDSWLREMSDYMHGITRQLVMLGTEGFFGMGTAEMTKNPGAGTACEGEDWIQSSSLPGVDVATMHAYWRQTEGVQTQGWGRMSFPQYASFLSQYIDLHVSIAGQFGKPLLMEEFNVAAWHFSESERAAIFRLVFDKLHASKASGGPLCGAMVWNVALSGSGSPDSGYNIYLDASVQAASGPSSSSASGRGLRSHRHANAAGMHSHAGMNMHGRRVLQAPQANQSTSMAPRLSLSKILGRRLQQEPVLPGFAPFPSFFPLPFPPIAPITFPPFPTLPSPQPISPAPSPAPSPTLTASPQPTGSPVNIPIRLMSPAPPNVSPSPITSPTTPTTPTTPSQPRSDQSPSPLIPSTPTPTTIRTPSPTASP